MPSSTAGLLRFYQEETFGIKVRPEIIIIAAIILIVLVALAPIIFPA